MGYKVGISSGAFGVAAAEEKPLLLGLYKKAQRCITEGVEFVQLDLESVAEFDEPELEKKMKENIIEKLGIIYGIHSETRAFGVMAAELDSAIATDYERGHTRIVNILEKSGKIGAKYVLVHTSESVAFPLLHRELQPTDLVDFRGRSLREFLEKNENKWLLDWLFKKEGGSFLWLEVRGRTLESILKDVKERFKTFYRLEHKGKEPSKEEIDKEIEKEKEDLKKFFVETVSSRILHYGPERWAYYLIARWMGENEDPLWEKIVKANIEFFAKRDEKTVEEWLKDNKIDLEKLSIDDENFRRHHELWVPAVSAKYIWGHLNPEDRFEDPKKIIEKYKIPLTFESPMMGRGTEEWARFYNPTHVYPLIEEVGPKYLQLAFDLEHMLSIRLDPELVIKLLPEDAGKNVLVIHAGWPSTLAAAHVPIPLGSEQQQYLYRVYYKLKEKGFGTDKDVFILYERGAPHVAESVVALKKIVEFLKNNIKPEDLIKHPEFYGIAPREVASEERQLVAIKEHARDPLKGLIATPEEAHTFLGRAATEKGKRPEEWKKEELR
jgi:hypothetical protein